MGFLLLEKTCEKARLRRSAFGNICLGRVEARDQNMRLKIIALEAKLPSFFYTLSIGRLFDDYWQIVC